MGGGEEHRPLHLGGGDGSGAEDESKADALPPTFVQWCARRVGVRPRRIPRERWCYRCWLCLACVAVLALAITVTVLAVEHASGMGVMHVMSVMSSVPTMKEWDAHRACLVDERCDVCALEPKMMMHPPPRTRVATNAKPCSM